MRKFSVIAGLLFCSLTLPAIAQDQVNVHWGPVIKRPANRPIAQIVGSDKTGFYALRGAKTGLFVADKTPMLERYDSKKSLAFSKDLVVPLPTKSKTKLEFQDIKYLKGQLVLFSSFLNKETDTYFSFANKISPDGTVSGDMVEMGKMENVSKRNKGNFDFVLSTDSSKILVFQNRPYEKNKAEKFDLKVLDSNLQPVYYKSIEMPKLDKQVGLSNYIVDNAGNTFVLMSIDKEKEEKSRKEQNHYYRIMAYFHKEDKVREYDVKLPGKFITDMSFILDKDQNLLVSGFYADNKKLSVGGLFFTKIDSKSQQVLAGSTKDFSPEFLANFMKEKKAQKEDAGIHDLELKKLLLKEDGSITMAAEQEWIKVVTTQTKTGTVTTYYYYNMGLVFANISTKGNIDWITYVPKKQVTRNDGGTYNSVSLLVNHDKLRVIYNDNAKNVKITDPKKQKYMNNVKKAVTTLITVNGDGSFSKTPLFPAKEAKTIVIPKFYLPENNALTIYSERGKDYRFGQISFN